jgi:arylsulfatase A-like enzyme
VYTSHKSKIAEHGGNDIQDRNVPILLATPGGPHGTTNSSLVETTQIAPTLLSLLGLDPNQLQAVRAEGTKGLP